MVTTSPVQQVLSAYKADKNVAERAATRVGIDTTVYATDSAATRVLKARAQDQARAAGTLKSESPMESGEITSSDSAVARTLKARKVDVAKRTNNLDENEDFLRMKAYEISSRISLYKNLGLTTEYQAAQAEGVEVVKKYQALLQKNAAAEKTINKAV